MNLNEIFTKNCCDRGELKHHYHTVYEKELEKYKTSTTFKLLEVGIYKGAGISSWIDYFPNAKNIIGIDIFDRVDPSSISILNNKKVKWIQGDSATVNLSEHLSTRERFDVIIDDGMHSPRSNKETFLNLIPFLKKTGVYFIEDVWPIDIMSKAELNHRWIKTHPERFALQEYNKFLSVLNDYEVTRIDLRKISKCPDSYLFKIEYKK